MAYKKRLYGTRLDKIQEEMDNEVRLVEDVAKENMNSKYVEIAPIKSNTTSKNSSKKTTEWKKGKNEKTQKSLISNTNSKSNNLLALTVDRKNGLSLIKDTTTGRTFLGANNEKKSVLDKTSITNKILGVNNTNNFNSTWNYGTSTKKDVTETTEDIAPVKTTTKREGTGTTNEEGYTYTGRNWGDYWYQAYSTNKDLKIYEKDGKYFVQYSDGKYQNVDNISFMTTKEANTKALEEAKKLGYKANTSNLSISNQIKLDTANLTSEEQQEYTEDLIRQQKDKLEDLERKNKVHTGGNGVRGAIGGIKAYASNLIESIDNNIVEPIANAKDNYNVGKMTEALGMEAYKKMMGEENNYDELKEEYDKFITFNEDIVSEGNYLDQTIQTLPNQIGGLAAGIKRGGLSSAAGAILGGAVGAVTTKTPQGAAAGATTGAKWLGGAGYVTGQSDYTYKLESGLQYQTLIDMGVPEDIAKKEAQDTGVVNALIESGESILDLFTLGSVSKLKDVFTGNLIKKYGEETVSKWVGKSVVKNALSEGAEEATQEAVSIHNEKQATKQAGIERDDSQDKKRIVESAIVGALAGGISDGSVTAATGITKTGINTIKQKAALEQEIQELENKPFSQITVKENERLQAIREELETINTNLENEQNNETTEVQEDKAIDTQEKVENEKSTSNLKEQQLEIVLKENPMIDDYHTGIRSIDDIKTFDEVINDDESFVWGDFTQEDAKQALEKGTVTVYSSKPITNGSFVSTSQNQAKDYAGNGKIYSQEVSLEDVAWINGDEGQYAKVENTKYSLNEEEILSGIYENVPHRTSKDNQKNNKRIEEYLESKYPDYHITFTNYKNDGEVVINLIETKQEFENRLKSYKNNNFKETSRVEIIPEDAINFKYNERPEFDGKEWRDLEDIRTKIETLTNELNKNGEFGDYGVDYEESHASPDATYIKLEDNEGEIRTIRVANHKDSTGWSDYNLRLSDYKSKIELINDLKKLIYNVRNGQYDGIIADMGSSYKGSNEYIVFDNNQVENITDSDTNSSLGKDIKLQVEEAIAPLKEQINELTEQLTNNTTDNVKVSENPNMEQMAPISKPVTQEEIEQLSTESLNSFTDKDVAPEMEQETYYLPDTMTMDNKSLKMLVKNIKTELNLDKTQVAELENAIQEFSTSETVTKEDLYNTIKNKFSEQSIEYKNEEVATIKNLLRNYPIQVSDNVKAEFSSSKTDGFNKVRQKNFNKLKFTNTGTPVDVAYQELNEIYPEFFPSNITNEGDQLKHIIDVANYNTIDVEKFVLDDETINSIVEFVYDSIQDYKFDRYVKDTETFNKAANKALTDKDIPTDMLDIGPVVSNSKITAPVKENALNSQKTVQELGEKNNYISNKADELYTELKGLKKGVRASEELGTILDLGYEWRKIKNALLNIKYKPDSIVDINSSIESTIREMIGRDYEAKYENMMYGLEQPNQNLSIKESNVLKLKNLEQSIKKYNNDAQESLELFDELILEKKQQYSELKRKDTNKANNLLQQITNLETRRDNIQVEYERKMNNVQKRIDNMNSKDFKTAEQRMTKQQEYREQARELIGDTSTWKDKKLGIQYQINIFKRNLRDIVKDAFGKADIQKADAIYEEYQGKYNQKEAKLKVESNKIKQPYVDLNLTKQEDAYVQMLGEYKYNPDTTITKKVVDDYYNAHKNKIDINKVNKAIESARETYDSLHERLNEVLRNQGMKEIGYRQGYFPHFTEEKQSMLAKLFDWKVHNNQIPTDIAGLTELNNPERSWQSFNKQRKGDTTDYSFSKGLDTYVHGALDWIYHIEDIQKRRALENEIRYQHSEKGIQEKIEAIYNNPDLDADEIQTQIEAVYGVAKNPLNNFVTDLRNSTNNLAGKKSTLDRSMEYATNRQIYSTMTNLSNRVNGNMVGGSISSALTNFIPITQSWAEVSPLSSLNATREVLKNTIKDDGTIAKSTFLTNRLVKEENLYKSGWDKARDFISAISTDAIDSFTSQVVWRSKYNENIKNGMNEFDAITNADQFAENVMAGRSRGNQPTIYNSKNPITKMFTSFQLEIGNQYGYMFKDMPIDIGRKSKAKLIKGYATMFLGAYVYNALYSSLTGRDAAFDPIGIVEDILKELGIGGDDEDEKSASEKFTAITEDLVQDLPFVGGLFGGGRVPISAAIPYDNPIKMFSGTATDALDAIAPIFNKDEEVKEKGEKALKDLTSEWLKPVTYLALPFGGGQISKSIKGLSMYDSDLPIAGSYNNSGDLRFTADDGLPGIAKSFLFGQYASESAQDYVDSGFKTIGKDNVEEMISLDMDSTEYRNYRNGLSKNKTIGEKLDYITNLDVTDKQKIIMIDYVASQSDDDFAPYKGKGKLEVTDNYIVAGNREYYKYIDNEGNEKWSKVDEEEAADLNSLGFSASGKNTYFSIKEEISSIANEYLENKDDLTLDNSSDEYKEAIKELSSDKKAGIIDKIKNTGLNDKQKAYLYGKYYSSDETLEKVTSSGISFDNYLTYEKDSLSLESTEEKVEYLYNSKMTDDAKTVIYETSVLTGFDNEDKYKAYKTAKAAGIDIDSWLSYKKQEFVADKDSSGKSISGSRKDKIFNYINSLSLSIPQKAILFRQEYPSDDTYNNQIVNYVGSLNISYEDKVNIFEELDMTVGSDGRVYWK